MGVGRGTDNLQGHFLPSGLPHWPTALLPPAPSFRFRLGHRRHPFAAFLPQPEKLGVTQITFKGRHRSPSLAQRVPKPCGKAVPCAAQSGGLALPAPSPWSRMVSQRGLEMLPIRTSKNMSQVADFEQAHLIPRQKDIVPRRWAASWEVRLCHPPILDSRLGTPALGSADASRQAPGVAACI